VPIEPGQNGGGRNPGQQAKQYQESSNGWIVSVQISGAALVRESDGRQRDFPPAIRGWAALFVCFDTLPYPFPLHPV